MSLSEAGLLVVSSRYWKHSVWGLRKNLLFPLPWIVKVIKFVNENWPTRKKCCVNQKRLYMWKRKLLFLLSLSSTKRKNQNIGWVLWLSAVNGKAVILYSCKATLQKHSVIVSMVDCKYLSLKVGWLRTFLRNTTEMPPKFSLFYIFCQD